MFLGSDVSLFAEAQRMWSDYILNISNGLRGENIGLGLRNLVQHHWQIKILCYYLILLNVSVLYIMKIMILFINPI